MIFEVFCVHDGLIHRIYNFTSELKKNRIFDFGQSKPWRFTEPAHVLPNGAVVQNHLGFIVEFLLIRLRRT